jgi:hypothetical protein
MSLNPAAGEPTACGQRPKPYDTRLGQENPRTAPWPGTWPTSASCTARTRRPPDVTPAGLQAADQVGADAVAALGQPLGEMALVAAHLEQSRLRGRRALPRPPAVTAPRASRAARPSRPCGRRCCAARDQAATLPPRRRDPSGLCWLACPSRPDLRGSWCAALAPIVCQLTFRPVTNDHRRWAIGHEGVDNPAPHRLRRSLKHCR